ncbi:unnamed protein product [Rhizophagus irregularis]|nr:unnamed protein product [Rhizophagus irregularis]
MKRPVPDVRMMEMTGSGRLDNGNRNEPERRTFDDGVRNEPGTGKRKEHFEVRQLIGQTGIQYFEGSAVFGRMEFNISKGSTVLGRMEFNISKVFTGF